MDVYWLGHACFRVRGRDATVVMDPCPPSTGYRIGRLTADIVTVSHDAPEAKHLQAISNEAKVITGPGEYEIAGVLISGIRTDHDKNQGTKRNTAYVVDIDDIRVCHLGNLSHVPHADDAELLSGADVLLVPVGGGGALSAAAAAETVSLLEPKLIVPMLYKTEAATADLEPVDRFLKEMSAEAKKAESRLTITRSNLPHDPTVVLLEYRG